jgi:hypothetical protein
MDLGEKTIVTKSCNNNNNKSVVPSASVNVLHRQLFLGLSLFLEPCEFHIRAADLLYVAYKITFISLI